MNLLVQELEKEQEPYRPDLHEKQSPLGLVHDRRRHSQPPSHLVLRLCRHVHFSFVVGEHFRHPTHQSALHGYRRHCLDLNHNENGS